MKTCLKRFVLVVLSTIFLFPTLLHAYPVRAQITEAKNPSPTPTIIIHTVTPVSEYENQLKKKAIGLYTTLQLGNCIFIGQRCLGKSAETSQQDKTTSSQSALLKPYYEGGLFGVVNSLMAATYAHPPASLSYSINRALQNLSPVGKAYAQTTGLGFNTLASFVSLWSLSRNISYGFIIVILITTGFLLIFRFKTNPNVSMDLEKIIARTVLVILAITFSYTIAGFLIDLMYLVLLFIFNIARENNLINAAAVESLYGHVTPNEIFQYLTQQNDPNAFVDTFLTIIPNNFRMVMEGILTTALSIQSYPTIASGLQSMSQFVEFDPPATGGPQFDPGSLVASALALPLSGVIGSILTGLIIRTVLLIGIYTALLFLYFKILFILIGSYIDVVFSVIFAPFLLLVDIFPGKNQFSIWFKRLVANIITFPLLAILLLTGANITYIIAQSTNTILPPPLAGMSQAILASIVGIGVLISIPVMIERVKRWITPEYTLVHFPTTPGALLGTVASIMPFIPYAGGLLGSFSAFKYRPGGKESDVPPKPHIPEVPHMPHQQGSIT